MIRLRMGVADVVRMRFAFSPLAEVIESLFQLSSRRVSPLHRGWWEASLHPEVSVRGEILRIDKPRHSVDHDLAGAGLVLMPSVFAWPNLVVDKGPDRPASLIYACRGVGTLWGGGSRPAGCEDDTLGALLGHSRAAILSCLGLPKSTTELARELGQSTPSVSFHLSVLRRSGLVTSWRSGRRVLYRRTPLASGLVAAGGSGFEGGSAGPE